MVSLFYFYTLTKYIPELQMNFNSALNNIGAFINLDLLAKQIVEGFVTGMHKSPFHGFSAEFAEHKIYNSGESTKHIDWKLFAKTDRLYTKRYEEETNLRCHIIIDNSTSMHYPKTNETTEDTLNKIEFSVLASACFMYILKKQRDAFGLSIYSNDYEYYAPEKGSERHYQMLLNALNNILENQSQKKTTETYKYLHLIAEKIHRRSLIFLFTDMFETNQEATHLYEALRHLKHQKHEVVLFHVFNKEKELSFNFTNAPKRFIDIETGTHIDLYPDTIKHNYSEAVSNYFNNLKLKCGQYGITYVEADVNRGLNFILTKFMLERQKFI